jgi:hypothetical protein
MGQAIHPAILSGIERFYRDRWNAKQPARLEIQARSTQQLIDRPSVEYLVRFLQQRQRARGAVKELHLVFFRLLHPSDGRLDTLLNFFESDTTLTMVALSNCDFGSQQATVRLLGAFYRNTSITELHITNISHLRDAARGTCLAELLQNNEHFTLRSFLNLQAVVPMQPRGLHSNCHLKGLCLRACGLGVAGGGGLCLIADILVGNTTLESLDISDNRIRSDGLPHITRILESTQLKDISFDKNNRILGDDNATRHLGNALARNRWLQTLRIATLFDAATHGASPICQALESNTTLQHLVLGAPFSFFLEIAFERMWHVRDRLVIDQLVESLPKMKGLKKLTFLHGWENCIRMLHFFRHSIRMHLCKSCQTMIQLRCGTAFPPKLLPCTTF